MKRISRPLLLSVGFGLLIGLANYSIQKVMKHAGYSSLDDTYLEDILIAVLASVVAFLAFNRQAEQRARLDENLRLSMEMNHHIRNALQTISGIASLRRSQSAGRNVEIER